MIFGGRDEENTKLNDTWLFNLSSYEWDEIYCSIAPLPRSGHSATLYKDMMLIFGGIHEVTRELDDMHILDFRSRRWVTLFEELSSPAKL